MAPEMNQRTAAYPKTASLLALVGGILILLGGVIFIALSVFILPHLSYANLTPPKGLDPASIPGLVSGFVGIMGGFGLVSGIIVLVSAIMVLANSGERRTWGILILIFSVLSFIGLGGFVIGAILGIVGGVMILRWKPPAQ
jgi:Family of unknown function (DUF6114)